MEKVLLVAFDGMDKRRVEKFELKNIYLETEEFGSIDNVTDVNEIKTAELFSTMITGQAIDGLDREGMKKTNHPLRKKILESLITGFVKKNVRGAVRLNKALLAALDVKRGDYTSADFEKDTLFEKIENSRPMFIPGYNPSKFWVSGGHRSIMSHEDFDKYDAIELWKSREHRYRKESLFSELENDIVSPRDFLMCHFHLPDFFQHLKGDEQLNNYDEDFLRDLYRELDRLAGEIRDKALENDYDAVVFMSDHGLPTASAHNENAFYSCNKELFPNKTPKIADFHDKILELVDE